MRSRGFFAGALAGLAIALLVVGAASFVPQTGNPLKAAAQSVTTTVATTAVTTSSTSSGSGQFAAPPVAQIAGLPNGVGAPASSSTTAAPPAGAGAASSLSEAQSGPTAAGTPARQEPGSLLAVLPAEGAGRVVATVSPLLIGLLVAALVYGAYARRQDSAS
jgi:hypothetical protein